MPRLVTIGLESGVASVLLIPALWMFWNLCRRNMTKVKKGMMTVFAAYLCAVCSATGLPTAAKMHFAPRLNLIPFIDIITDPGMYLFGSFLNILMFIPFGFFVPLLWRQMRSLKRMIAASFLFSLFIELAQMFSGRLTDVDDLIFNTLGGIVGFWLARDVYKKIAMRYGLHDYKNQYDIVGLIGLVALCTAVMYFVRPLVEIVF